MGFNAIPKVAFVPIPVVWFGIGSVAAILTACLIASFPSWSTSPPVSRPWSRSWRTCWRVLGAMRLDVLFKVGLARSPPYFFVSLKLAITLAFVGAVVSVTVASNQGIGYLMRSAGSQMRMPPVFADWR